MSNNSSTENSQPRKGDLTQGPVLRTLVSFSIPLLIGNLIQTLNGAVNAVWVGRLLGESALAATANANVVMFLLFAAVFGLGNATTIRVGQHFGAHDIVSARKTFGSGIGFCLIISAIAGLGGLLISSNLLELMATPEDSLVQANAYLRIIFITLPLGTLSMMLGMGLRGTGDSQTPMRAMILTVILDIVLNPLLILGIGPLPALGITGSAIAMALANLGGVLLLIYRIYGHNLPLRLSRPELGYLIPRRDDLAYIVSKGIPMGAQMLLVASSQVVVITLVNREGLNATAAYGVLMQLWNFLQMPAFAISTAVSAIVAQSIGAQQHLRVTETTRIGMFCNLAMTGLLAGLLIVASHPLLAIFLGGDSPALPVAQHIQYVVTWTYIIMGAMMVLSGTMRAYGVVWVPLIIQMIALYPVRLGFYWVLYPQLQGDALWWSFPVSTIASALLTYWLYTRGSWRDSTHTDLPVRK